MLEQKEGNERSLFDHHQIPGCSTERQSFRVTHSDPWYNQTATQEEPKSFVIQLNSNH